MSPKEVRFSLFFVAGVAQAESTPDANGTPRIACQLSPGGFTLRKGEIEDLFAGHLETRELEDGYAFRFPGDGEWAGRLVDFISSERQCCEFFKFELVFEPHQGPIWLRVRGSQEVKAFLEALMSAG